MWNLPCNVYGLEPRQNPGKEIALGFLQGALVLARAEDDVLPASRQYSLASSETLYSIMLLPIDYCWKAPNFIGASLTRIDKALL